MTETAQTYCVLGFDELVELKVRRLVPVAKPIFHRLDGNPGIISPRGFFTQEEAIAWLNEQADQGAVIYARELDEDVRKELGHGKTCPPIPGMLPFIAFVSIFRSMDFQ